MVQRAGRQDDVAPLREVLVRTPGASMDKPPLDRPVPGKDLDLLPMDIEGPRPDGQARPRPGQDTLLRLQVVVQPVPRQELVPGLKDDLLPRQGHGLDLLRVGVVLDALGPYRRPLVVQDGPALGARPPRLVVVGHSVGVQDDLPAGLVGPLGPSRERPPKEGEPQEYGRGQKQAAPSRAGAARSAQKRCARYLKGFVHVTVPPFSKTTTPLSSMLASEVLSTNSSS